MKGCKRCATNVDSAFSSKEDIICKSCREDLKKNLGKCEDWEINKKQLIKKLLAEEGSDLEYAKELHEGGNTYKICQKCATFIEETNGYRDIRKIECDCQVEAESSNQIKSNQSSSESLEQGLDNKKPNYLPWILGGIGVVSFVGGLV